MPVSPFRTPRVGPALVVALATALLLGGSPLVVRAEETAAPSATPAPTPTATPSPAPTPTPSPTPSPTPAGALPPAPAVPPGPVFASGPIPVTGSITLYGRGYGHGVGMSQWGARGRALAGQDAATILAHYYQATTLAAIDPATPIRVLLVSNFAPTPDRPARIVGLNGPWTIDGVDAAFPAGGGLVVAPGPTGWQASVLAPDGTPLWSAPVTGALVVRPAAPDTLLQVTFKASASNVYRGAVRLITTSRVTAINELGLDQYLLGVVPAEMSYRWPAEALKAQAIAARSYALRRLRPASAPWDVYDDTRSQVYRGVLVERPPVSQAILDTSGQVLMAGSSVANTPFHSADGGATESNEFVWTRADGTVIGKPVPELRGSSDRAPDGTPYDAASPSASWRTATYSIEAFSAIMAANPRTAVGLVTAIAFARPGVSGRAVAVTLYGTGGVKTVSGTIFQAVFNANRPPGHPALRSTLIDLAPIP